LEFGFSGGETVRKLLPLAVGLFLAVQGASAAEITVSDSLFSPGMKAIGLTGDIRPGDDRLFQIRTAGIAKGFVRLNSRGGSLISVCRKLHDASAG
jgi:hypothetical protein